MLDTQQKKNRKKLLSNAQTFVILNEVQTAPCLVKETRRKRLSTLWFHVYGVLGNTDEWGVTV